MKRLFTTVVFALLLVTMAAGIALAYLVPQPGGGGLPWGDGGSSAACGSAARTAIERPLDPPAHRLAWTTGPRVGNWQIVTAEADGSDRTRLTTGETFHGDPAWSPDGTKVAYVQRDDKEVDDVWVADADGSNARLVVKGASTPAGARTARGSPTGEAATARSGPSRCCTRFQSGS